MSSIRSDMNVAAPRCTRTPRSTMTSSLPVILFVMTSFSCIARSQSSSSTPAATSASTPTQDPSFSASCPSQCHCSQEAFQVLGGRKLNTVNCSSQNMRTIPSGIPISTESLILSWNHLTDLYNQLPALHRLLHMDLSHNQIKQLGRGQLFQNFTNLRYLDLSYNDFRTLFSGVFRDLRRLEVLVMKNVLIRHMDEHVFDGLVSLRRLDLEHNSIYSVFPEWFIDLINLESLNMDNNDIAYLNSGNFASLNNLRHLRLSKNKIRATNDHAFIGLDNLYSLHLNDNHFVKVPSTALRDLKSLKTLNFGNNPVSQLETGDFSQLPVKELIITNSRVLKLVDRASFSDLQELEDLHLDNNRKLQYIDPEAFIGVPRLKTLHLFNNNLSALQEDILKYFKRPVNVSLYGNPLLCDCNIHWIHSIISSNSSSPSNTTKKPIRFLQPENLTCASPSQLRALKVNNLTHSQMSSECPPVLVGAVNETVDKKLGDPHVFQCRALGIPTPKIHWILPDGEVLNETSNLIHLQLKNTGSLTIYHLKPKDSGVYTCVAENHLGQATSSTELVMENIDLHIFPQGVSSTFVTIVWNGTGRGSFPQYEILYKLDEERADHFESVTVSKFLRSYTINNLKPESRYKFCIAVRDDEEGGYVQISCTSVRTQDANFMLQGINNTSNVAVAVVLGIVAGMMLVICMVTVAARKYRQRQYETPEKSLVNNMSQIPLENIYSPLMSNLGS